MCLEMVISLKLVVTRLALMNPLLIMNSLDICFQRALHVESFVTKRTFMILFFCMLYFDMLPMIIQFQQFVACTALMLPFTSMHLVDVIFQQILFREYLGTHLSFMHRDLRFKMDPLYMLFKRCPYSKRLLAHHTLQIPSLFMDAFYMVFECICTCKFFPTFVTDICHDIQVVYFYMSLQIT